ncbi:hypothetical protein ACP4OV_018818 [Aristida adscensionis]
MAKRSMSSHARINSHPAKRQRDHQDPPCPNSMGTRSRDWANLADGPAGLIAELALANDVADYVRFRAVCRPWRRCTPDPRAGGLDGRYLPRRWIMLDKAIDASRRRRFLNVSTGECIRMDLPELADAEHWLLALTPEGLLLLLHEPTMGARLLNPLTRQLTALPPVTAMLTREQQRAGHSGRDLAEALWVTGAGLVVDAAGGGGGAMVAVCFHCYSVVVAVAKPGDERWALLHDRYVSSTMAFAGRFYLAAGTRIMVLDTSGASPQLRTVVDRRVRFSGMADTAHLVDNAGELMLVHRALRRVGDSL